jgi:hypothetical protein
VGVRRPDRAQADRPGGYHGRSVPPSTSSRLLCLFRRLLLRSFLDGTLVRLSLSRCPRWQVPSARSSPGPRGCPGPEAAEYQKASESRDRSAYNPELGSAMEEASSGQAPTGAPHQSAEGAERTQHRLPHPPEKKLIKAGKRARGGKFGEGRPPPWPSQGPPRSRQANPPLWGEKTDPPAAGAVPNGVKPQLQKMGPAHGPPAGPGSRKAAPRPAGKVSPPPAFFLGPPPGIRPPPLRTPEPGKLPPTPGFDENPARFLCFRVPHPPPTKTAAQRAGGGIPQKRPPPPPPPRRTGKRKKRKYFSKIPRTGGFFVFFLRWKKEPQGPPPPFGPPPGFLFKKKKRPVFFSPPRAPPPPAPPPSPPPLLSHGPKNPPPKEKKNPPGPPPPPGFPPPWRDIPKAPGRKKKFRVRLRPESPPDNPPTPDPRAGRKPPPEPHPPPTPPHSLSNKAPTFFNIRTWAEHPIFWYFFWPQSPASPKIP